MATEDPGEWETTEVLICGGGPVGALLSTLLGRMSKSNIVLEKEVELYPYPRAFTLGENGIRVLQGVGLSDYIYTDIGHNFDYCRFVSCRDMDLTREPFLRMNGKSNSGYTGHAKSIVFKQPVMEKCLRSVIADSPCSELRIGCTITSIDQDTNWAYVQYHDQQGKRHRIRSKFLVGADGKTGFTRKMYLESKGVVMEKTNSYEEVYISTHYHITPPTPDTHPNFPLWKLGYTPKQVYDAFIPVNLTFVCNPDRPVVCCRISTPDEPEQSWRFEFAVREGEDPKTMSSPDEARKILRPYLLHPGKRYNLQYDVEFPADCMALQVCAPYRFSSRMCNKWHVGRVMLAGDSAHVFPPFAGQGLLSGVMDASGLAWRLAIALDSPTKNFEPLLQSWSQERKQQIGQALAITVRNGDLLTQRNSFKIFVRDWLLWLIQLVPSWKVALEEMPFAPSQYTYEQGMAFVPELGGGVSLPQLYCCGMPTGSAKTGHEADVLYSDDVLFAPEKRGLFQLLLLADGAAEVSELEKTLLSIENQSPDIRLLIDEATYIVHDTSPTFPTLPLKASTSRLVRVATVDEFRQSRLSIGRSPQNGYDESALKKAAKGKRFVIVRADRFVFAASADRTELERAFAAVERVLSKGQAFEDA